MDVSVYSPAVRDLLSADRLPPLGPGRPNEAMREKLQELTIEKLLAPLPVRRRDFAAACLAGLWLHHDFLDQSHHISQDIPTTEGSWWHGILHRREPDYSNAKYWFRRVGPHPVFDQLLPAAQALARADPCSEADWIVKADAWDSFHFVDLCEAALTGRARCEMLCRRIQQREWELLFDYCYHSAVS